MHYQVVIRFIWLDGVWFTKPNEQTRGISIQSRLRKRRLSNYCTCPYSSEAPHLCSSDASLDIPGHLYTVLLNFPPSFDLSRFIFFTFLDVSNHSDLLLDVQSCWILLQVLFFLGSTFSHFTMSHTISDLLLLFIKKVFFHQDVLCGPKTILWFLVRAELWDEPHSQFCSWPNNEICQICVLKCTRDKV